MKRILFSAVVLTLLAGCQHFSEESALYAGRVETMENVVGDTWQIKAVWPWEDRTIRLRENLNEKAQAYCGKNGKGAQLLDAVTQKRKDAPGTEGILVFRCVSTLPAPTGGLFSDEE